jgi:hypothetical protein
MKATPIHKFEGERVSVAGLTTVIPNNAPIAFRTAKIPRKEASCIADRSEHERFRREASGSTHGSKSLERNNSIQLLEVRFRTTKCHKKFSPISGKQQRDVFTLHVVASVGEVNAALLHPPPPRSALASLLGATLLKRLRLERKTECSLRESRPRPIHPAIHLTHDALLKEHHSEWLARDRTYAQSVLRDSNYARTGYGAFKAPIRLMRQAQEDFGVIPKVLIYRMVGLLEVQLLKTLLTCGNGTRTVAEFKFRHVGGRAKDLANKLSHYPDFWVSPRNFRGL